MQNSIKIQNKKTNELVTENHKYFYYCNLGITIILHDYRIEGLAKIKFNPAHLVWSLRREMLLIVVK